MTISRAAGLNGKTRPTTCVLLVALVMVLVGRVLFFGPATSAQALPSLAGTWTLDASAGRGGRGNFAGFSTATRMVIKQSATEITIDTDTGTEKQIQTATYTLNGSENPVPGPLGWDTRAKASWREGKLLVAIKRSIDGPEGRLDFEIQDAYSVTGDILTLERSQGSRMRTMVYQRAK